MNTHKDYFKGRKITIMGLGLLGRGLGDAQFLAELGADLIVTDLKTAKELKPSLKKLSKYKSIKFVLGGHRLADFKNRDMILKSAGVPLDSFYIAEAKKNKIPVEMDASLFAKLAPKDVTIIGITGTRGKSTVTHLIYEILKADGKRVYLGGNVRGLATLPLIKKVKSGDTVLMELDSWQLQGFGEEKISPHISVFTNFLPDHLNYYKGDMKRYFLDKAHIFLYQKPDDYLITNAGVMKEIKRHGLKLPQNNLILKEASDVPSGWKVTLLGEHNKSNISLAVAAAEVLGVPLKTIRKISETFSGISGRLEHVASLRGVDYYNDTTATTPDGAIAALKSLSDLHGGIILIAGGKDKNLNYKDFAKEVKNRVKALILLEDASTTATDKIISALGKKPGISVIMALGMKEAVFEATRLANSDDAVVLSPAAASFGMFKNEFDRGDQFTALVKKLE